MTQTILLIGVVTFIIYTAFHIFYIIELQRTNRALRAFLENTEGNLNATLTELKGTLENIKTITANVGGITEDVRNITDMVMILEKGVEALYGKVKGEVATAAGANMAGLKAGITTGIATLVRSMQERRNDDDERRS
jgi:uncharacterized protein YoxC